MSNNFFVFLKGKRSSQRGVALLVTFFIMGIAVTIVLGVSVILLSELKMIRGIGNSVVAFSAADEGIEKTLYYDRQVKEAGWSRGICNICDSCSLYDCQTCTTTGPEFGCAPATCTDCKIEYTTDLIDKMFRVIVTISPGNPDIYQSYGVYKGVTRAIELSGN